MDTRETLLNAALKVLEEEGEAQFSTRAVLAIANVTAPTLYHHFGNADGLLSAAVGEAFAQFLASKKLAIDVSNPETGLRQGWDNYVRFAAARPRLYGAMMSRVLNGVPIQAAEQAFALLMGQIRAIGDTGRLIMDVDKAADVLWASANSAALLHVTSQLRKTAGPDPAVIDGIRESAMRSIITAQ